MNTYYRFYFITLLLFFCLNNPIQAQEIWQIQGTGFISPYTGQAVNCQENIVTAVDNSFFYLQTPDSRSDNDELSSQGIRVYLGQTPNVQVGDMINLSGMVSEYFNNSQITSSNAQITVISSNNPLPQAVQLDSNFPSGVTGSSGELERIEGMLTNMPEAYICGPTDGNFAKVKAGPIRSFREPGIPFPGTVGLPVWDNNPEVFYFRPGSFGSFAFPDMAGGMQLAAQGIFYQDNSDYILLPTTYDLQADFPIRAVRDKLTNEITVASLNALVLDEDEDNYAIRIRKLAKYILNQLKKPDILALQEIENIFVLNDLIEELQSIDPSIDYSPFLFQTSAGSSFQINPAYLVSSNIQDITVVQLGKNETFSEGGSLHNRAPLLLAGYTNSATPVPIQVLNVHIRSLIGVSSSSEVRKKRQEQAISIANMIQARQGENLIILGDFNAFQFSDGYVDVYNQISGHPSEGASLGIQNIVDPALIEISASVPPAEQYSYVFDDNGQMIDHCLSTQLQNMSIASFEFARGNADNSNSFLDDESVPFKVSDHDGFVLFLELETSLDANDLARQNFYLNYPNPFQAQDRMQLSLAREANLNFELIALDGSLLSQKNLGRLSAGIHELELPNELPTGLYFIRISNQEFAQVAKIFIKN